MKINKFSVLFAALVSLAAASSVSFAKQVPLYAEPADNAKSVGNIDLAAGVIPIYTPKGGAWVKVADPANGNVGWIKSSELSGNGTTSFSFSQRISGDEKNPHHSYQIIEFGSNQSKKSDKELQAQLMKIQAQQEALQRSVNQSIQGMMNDMTRLYQEYRQIMNDNGMPMILPIMIMPAQKADAANNKKQEAVTPVKPVPAATKAAEKK